VVFSLKGISARIS
jgi:hypothetical protein